MIVSKIVYVVRLLFCVTLLGCNNNSEDTETIADKEELKKTLIEANKIFVERENNRINSYIARHNYQMIETGTGLRYELLKETQGDKPVEKDLVTIVYTLAIVDGETLVGENGADTLHFKVGKSDVPTGISEGVQLIKEGENARFLLPTHLAYGLTGDEERIPSNAALIYKVQLIKVVKSKK